VKNFADAYASHLIKKIPMSLLSMAISVKGFPPPLIQFSTNEIFPSDFVRLYQALDGADIPVKLDVYEGMPHSSYHDAHLKYCGR
jgi:monoterpene epsilon-lactone hydrolase